MHQQTNKQKNPSSTKLWGSAVVKASHKNMSRSLMSRSLTSESMRASIAQTAKCCDEAQIGMTCKEVIRMMMHLTGGTSDQCENHNDYLICVKKMPELKNHGRVQRVK